jgi:branched-chain amino acid aminotransferase
LSASIINFDGQISKDGQLTISAQNRAFRYGDGCFESLRKMGGKIPLLKLHLQRLHVGMAALEIKPASAWTLDFWQAELEKTAGKFKNARIRIQVFRADGGAYASSNNAAHFLIEATPLEETAFPWHTDGLSVAICNVAQVQAGSLLSNLKTCNSLPYVMAANFARNHQLGESLLLNQHERIAESSSANIFVLRAGQVYTPPLIEGCVDGVFRKFLLQHAADGGFQIHEKPIRPADLRTADEVFLCNAVQGIRWVKLFGDRNFGNQYSRELLDWSNKYFRGLKS